MANKESDFLRTLYQNWSERMAADPEMSIEGLRALFDEWGKATLEAEGVCYKTDTVGGVDAIWALPVDADKAKVLIFTHGGGFAVGSADSHRKLAAHFAKALGANCLVLNYRLAPEHPYPAQIDDVVAVYKALLAQGISAENISTIGDSAGGNLAISSVLKMRELGLALPGSVIAMSPWIDMETTGVSLQSNAATDALVSAELLAGMAGMFLGESASANDPLTNPLYADFKDYPALYITAGSVEALLDDAVRIHEKAEESSVNTVLSIVEGMQHVFPFMAGRASEADAEIEKIAVWYKAL